MTKAAVFTLLVVFAAAASFGARRASAGTADGMITGVVFHDLDGDGVRDDGEPGLGGHRVELMTGNVHLTSVATDSAGGYTISITLPPGREYALRAVLDKSGGGLCAEFGFSFNPLVTSYCLTYSVPWHATSPASVPLVLKSGLDTEVDFGARPADVALVTGIALLEGERAPEGTLIEALVNGRECGTTTATADTELNYLIVVLGEGDREGCARSGDTVEFRVGGVVAPATFAYVSYRDRDPPTPALPVRNLTAMQSHAWFWFERQSQALPRDGLQVEAFIGGQVCGETQVEVVGGVVAGFSRLVVPSASVQPGCAHNAALVEFRVGGLRAETAVHWLPGVQRLNLMVQGDANCDFLVDPRDATLVLQYVARLVTSVPCHGDADRDRDIDAIDARHILEFAAGITNALPI